MANIQTSEVETEVKCNAEKMFNTIRHRLHHLPTIFPETYKGSEIIEGDGTKNGCVRIWKYVLPGSPEVLFVKCKNEDVDGDKMTIAFNVIDGDILKYYKHFVARVSVAPKGNGCLVKWCVEYQKLHEGVSDPHHYLEIFDKVNQKLEAHIANDYKSKPSREVGIK